MKLLIYLVIAQLYSLGLSIPVFIGTLPALCTFLSERKKRLESERLLRGE